MSIEAVNERLTDALMGVRIEQIGNNLYLRATLPQNPIPIKASHRNSE